MTVTKSALRRAWNGRVGRYDRAQNELLRVVSEVIADLSPQYDVRPVPFIDGSRKGFESFYEKACRYEREGRVEDAGDCFREIKDIARVRIICQTLPDSKQIERLLEENDAIHVVGPIQRHTGAERGYRGVHIEVDVDALDGGKLVATTCEIQIHTAVQFAWSLYTHKDFYKGGDVTPVVGELMAELSDLLNVADNVAGTLIRAVEEGDTKKVEMQS